MPRRRARSRWRPRIDWAQLHAERRRYGLDGTATGRSGRDGRIAKNRHAGDAWRNLLEQFQPFRRSMPYSIMVNPVTLPPGRAKLATKPGADRIDDLHEHNRDGAGRPAASAATLRAGAATMTSGASATNSAA